MVDAVRQMLGSIEATGKEGERNDQELIASLTHLCDSDEQSSQHSSPASPDKESGAGNDSPQAAPAVGEILVRRGVAKADEVADAVQQQNAGDPRHVGEILVEKGTVKPQDVVDALNIQQQAPGLSASDSTIRVDVSLLDQLMNRVGELVHPQPDSAVY